jgi:hypothetical protein
MKRVLLISAGVLMAGGLAAAPAVTGLAGNPSFSHQIPIRVPSQVRTPQLLDDHLATGSPTAVPRPGVSPHTEAGDDRSSSLREPDRRSSRGEPEPSDDRGSAGPGGTTGATHHSRSADRGADGRGDGSSRTGGSDNGGSDNGRDGGGSGGRSGDDGARVGERTS